MANYTQWHSYVHTRGVRRVTWVCGDQHVLIDEVATTIRALLHPGALDQLTMHAGEHTDAQIWAATHQYPLTPGATRLVTIRDADTITTWTPLATFLAGTRQLPGVHLLFISTATDLPHRLHAGKRTLKEHVAAIKAPRGQLVRCVMPNEADALAWTRRQAPTLDEHTAGYLLGRCGANLATVAAVAAKLRLLTPRAATAALIDELCQPAPAHTFADNLLRRDKPAALISGEALSRPDTLAAITVLERRLDLLHALWQATATGRPTYQIEDTPRYLINQYTPIAKHYDRHRCAYSRALLAVVDDALRSGAAPGAIQALVALW